MNGQTMGVTREIPHLPCWHISSCLSQTGLLWRTYSLPSSWQTWLMGCTYIATVARRVFIDQGLQMGKPAHLHRYP